MTPNVGDEESLGVAAQGDPRWDTALFFIPHFEHVRFGEVTLFEGEPVNDFVARAAAIESPAVVREFDAIKRFVQGELARDAGGWNIHDRNLVPAVAAVQHRDIPAAGMNRNVDWKITK